MLFSSNSFAQSDYDNGLASYDKEEYKKAAGSFKKASKKDKRNPEIWNLLGMSYLKLNERKKARKSFEKAVKFGPQKAVYYSNLAYVYFLSRKPNKVQSLTTKAIELDSTNSSAYYFRGLSFLWENRFDKAAADAEKAIATNSKSSAPYALKANILLRKFWSVWAKKIWTKAEKKDFGKLDLTLLEQSIATLRTCTKICENGATDIQLKTKIESAQAVKNYFDKPKQKDDPSYEEIKFLKKPRASYTDEAIDSSIQGIILLAVQFSANGKIGNILVLKGLGGGLNEKSITAARRISFVPAKRNGKPIGVVKVIQYSFGIY